MTEHAFEPMRRAMVASQLRTTGVNDPRVLAAMGEVRRERFVPPAQIALAYADAMVPLLPGRWLSSPMALGRMLTEARLRGHERALVIGAATGYAAAVLARLAGSVTAVEEDAELYAFAKKALAGTEVDLVKAPLARGHAKGGPYDFILIDGAAEAVPRAIVDQVADGGEVALAIWQDGVTQLALGRVAGGAFGTKAVADVAMAPLPGFETPRGFSF